MVVLNDNDIDINPWTPTQINLMENVEVIFFLEDEISSARDNKHVPIPDTFPD